MRILNFRKTVRRNPFTIIFGGIGTRRTVFSFAQSPRNVNKRSKMNKVRRAHQGWRNRVFGRLQAIKINRWYGRRTPTTPFRR